VIILRHADAEFVILADRRVGTNVTPRVVDAAAP